MTNLAFFGATGGCAGFCLVAALKDGYNCTALARTPSKLEDSLVLRGVSLSLIKSNLRIICGDVRDPEAVKVAITDAAIIISGIGAYPEIKWSLRQPFTSPLVSTDKTICTDASAAILKACQLIHGPRSVSKPVLILVSTAGVQEQGAPRALPLAYVPWYGWLLRSPLDDKIAMEELVTGHMDLPESERGISSYVIVKPSLLTNGEADKTDVVRVGLGHDPPVGYGVDRKAVGLWMFRHLIVAKEYDSEWKNGRVTITY